MAYIVLGVVINMLGSALGKVLKDCRADKIKSSVMCWSRRNTDAAADLFHRSFSDKCDQSTTVTKRNYKCD